MTPPRRRQLRPFRWASAAIVAIACVALLAAAGTDLMLHLGPTRAAAFRGKRVAGGATSAGLSYRVSYDYDAGGGRRPSDTDRVSHGFYLHAHYGSPLRVRTFGVGTFRFARLAGAANRADEWIAAARWAAVVVIIAAWRLRRRFLRKRAALGVGQC